MCDCVLEEWWEEREERGKKVRIWTIICTRKGDGHDCGKVLKKVLAVTEPLDTGLLAQ